MAACNAIDAIAFDLDGTLINSVPDVRAAINRLLVSEGRSGISLEQTLSLVGQGARVMMEQAMMLGGEAPMPDALDRMVETYIGFYQCHPADLTTIYPGVVEVLESLAARGIPMAICSNKPFVMTKLVLKTLGLDQYFDAVTGGDNVPHRKPDGRHITHTLDLMGKRYARAVMVGDSEIDVAAGKDAGVPVIAVTYGYTHVAVADLGADVLIDRFNDLPDTLDALARA
jgi:phosphoglycolate phosphatase